MTIHSMNRQWKLGQPATPQLLDELTRMLRHNRQKRKWMPAAFAILSEADAAYHVLGVVLDRYEQSGQGQTFRDFMSELVDPTAQHREAFLALGEQLHARLYPENDHGSESGKTEQPDPPGPAG